MSAAIRMLLVTGGNMPGPDDDSSRLLDALRARHVDAAVVPWTEPAPWETADLVVIRTPWDYVEQRDAFLDWAGQVDVVTRLVNPIRLLTWNSHKSYLVDLRAGGVPTIATTVVTARATAAEQAMARGAHGDEVVIKPAVSAGAAGAFRGRADSEAAAAHLAQLISTGDALVQPFAPSVMVGGETSLLYFGGILSHAVRKIPATGEYRVQEHHGGRVVLSAPSAAEEAVALAALAHAPAPTAYARVDLVDVGGRPAIMELELLEPELFFRMDVGAAGRYADHLVAEVANPPSA